MSATPGRPQNGEPAPEAAWRRYLRFWRPNPAADIDDELQFHVESRINEFIALGMTPDQARRAPTDPFGDAELILEMLRPLTRERETTMRLTAWIETIRQDLGFAVR